MRFLSTLCLLVLAAYARARAGCGCEPLGALANGRHDTVSTVAELRAALAGQESPLEIYLRPGDYALDAPLEIGRPGIIIRSLDGNRAGVTIHGNGDQFPALLLSEANATVADLTIGNVGGTAIAVVPTKNAGNIIIHNVAFIDAADGFIRMSCPATLANCFVECCSFAYTAPRPAPVRAPGIDVESVSNLFIQDCAFNHIVSGKGGGAAMVVRGASRNVTIERCRFVDCDMGITLGDSADLSRSVQGGLIRANFIKGHSGSGSAITINGAQGITIDHNTIYSPGGASPRSIDVRFSQSLGDGATDNLMDEVIEQRDGVLALFTEGNLEHIPASSFRNAGLGDLHLVAGSAAIDAAAGAQEEDIDCQALTDGHPDVGADEYVPSSGAETLAGRLPREIDYDAIGNTVVVRGLGGRDVAVRAVDMMGNSVAEISGCVGERLRLPSLGRGIYMLVARGRRGEAISRKVVVEGGR